MDIIASCWNCKFHRVKKGIHYCKDKNCKMGTTGKNPWFPKNNVCHLEDHKICNWTLKTKNILPIY